MIVAVHTPAAKPVPIPVPAGNESQRWAGQNLVSVDGFIGRTKVKEIGILHSGYPTFPTRPVQPLGVASFDDAVSAAQKVSISTNYEPNSVSVGHDKYQALAVLQGPSGAWYAAGLGTYFLGTESFSIDTPSKVDSVDIKALNADVKAVVGGRSMVDLRS